MKTNSGLIFGEFLWKDQQWGYNKGAISAHFAKHTIDPNASKNILEKELFRFSPAPRPPRKDGFCINLQEYNHDDHDDPSFMPHRKEDAYIIFKFKVGGGGGHRIEFNDFKVYSMPVLTRKWIEVYKPEY